MVFSLVLRAFLLKALLDELSLSVVSFLSEEKPLSLLLHCRICHSIMLRELCIRVENIHTILGYFSISQSSHYNIIMASICTDQYCIRPSAMLGLGQWGEQCNLTMLGFQVLSNIYCFSLTHLCSPLNLLCIRYCCYYCCYY